MARISWLLLLTGVALSGCGGASQYEAETQRKAIEAQNVMPQNFKPDLLAFLRTYLNSPENVRNAALSEPRKLFVESTERYAACLRYDARNSAGGYLGLRDHLAVFVSGKFDRLIELGRVGAEGSVGNPMHQPLREYCATVQYQPFPELERLRR
jgi:hypothetical protein